MLYSWFPGAIKNYVRDDFIISFYIQQHLFLILFFIGVKMAFDAFRSYGGPTQHSDNKNPVTVDVLEVGFIFGFCLLALCFCGIIPGYRGVRVRSKGIQRLFFIYFIFRGCSSSPECQSHSSSGPRFSVSC